MNHLPEENKKPGLCYVFTDDGVELPVIDVTHPAFALTPSREELAASRGRFEASLKRRERLPGFLRRFFQRHLERKSILLRGLGAANGTFLNGMNTYLFKLGPGNLGRAYSLPVDRHVSAAFPALMIRIRLQEMAGRIAAGLVAAAEAHPEGPLVSLGIAGGHASDSLNALILLRKNHPQLAATRSFRIEVMDLHAEAPHFGERALAALQKPGCPLEGLRVTFTYTPYDWSKTATLAEKLKSLGRDSALVVSSEGGLFNYGSDEEIRDNLSVLQAEAPRDCEVIGTATWDSPFVRSMNRYSRIGSRWFTREGLTTLAQSAEWRLLPSEGNPFSQLVAFRKLA